MQKTVQQKRHTMTHSQPAATLLSVIEILHTLDLQNHTLPRNHISAQAISCVPTVRRAAGGRNCIMSYPPPPVSNKQFGPTLIRSKQECSLDTPFSVRDNTVKQR